MKAKEKAKELVFRFGKIDHINNRCLPFKQSKQCALIAVDERINILAKIIELLGNDDLNAMRLINKEVKEQIKIMEEIESYESK